MLNVTQWYCIDCKRKLAVEDVFTVTGKHFGDTFCDECSDKALMDSQLQDYAAYNAAQPRYPEDATIPGIDVDYSSTAAEYRAELRREREVERHA